MGDLNFGSLVVIKSSSIIFFPMLHICSSNNWSILALIFHIHHYHLHGLLIAILAAILIFRRSIFRRNVDRLSQTDVTATLSRHAAKLTTQIFIHISVKKDKYKSGVIKVQMYSESENVTIIAYYILNTLIQRDARALKKAWCNIQDAFYKPKCNGIGFESAKITKSANEAIIKGFYKKPQQ